MNRKTIVFLIIFLIILILAGIFVYVYFFKEKAPEIVETKNKVIYVSVVDVNTKKQLVSNFSIVYNNTLYTTSISRNDSFVEVEIPESYNQLEFWGINNDYYSDMNLRIGSFSKVVIEMYKIGNIKVEQIGNLSGTSRNIKLNITTDDNNRELHACVRWSGNIIDVESDYKGIKEITTQLDCEYYGFQWIPDVTECNTFCKIGLDEASTTPGKCSSTNIDILPPTRLAGKIDKCFYIKTNIKVNEPFLLNLRYKAYSTLNLEDYIDVYIIDSNNDIYNKYRIEDEVGNDVGAKDVLFRIK